MTLSAPGTLRSLGRRAALVAAVSAALALPAACGSGSTTTTSSPAGASGKPEGGAFVRLPQPAHGFALGTSLPSWRRHRSLSPEYW